MADQLTVRTASGQAGFTLIELLVVITIVSVLSVSAALVATRRSAETSTDLATFQRSFDRMRSLAVHSQQARGLYLSARGQRAATLRGGKWQTTGPEIRWRDKARVSNRQGSIGIKASPQLVFLPNGQTSPFSVEFSRPGGLVRCQGDGWTGLTCESG